MRTITQHRPDPTHAGEHAHVVRRGDRAFDTGDIRALHDLLDELAPWHSLGHGPVAGNTGHVVSLHHATGPHHLRRHDVGCCIGFEVRDGRIVRDREHVFDLHAGDAFWA